MEDEGRNVLMGIYRWWLFFWAATLIALAPGGALGQVLRVATTTSTQNSGLSDYLLAAYKKSTGQEVQVIAAGTGKALKLGESGDVAMVIVHAPKLELSYVAKGVFLERKALMHNFFVVVGPLEDPAGLGGRVNVRDSLGRIARRQALFFSRGDRSGTHIKELELWEQVQVKPAGPWYQEVGLGMGQTLTIANQRRAYTLSDNGTFFAFKARLELRIYSNSDPVFRNPYSVLLVNPARHPGINYTGAKRFQDWLLSGEGQKLIGAFRANGKQLFFPGAAPRQVGGGAVK